jgi:hypothetical protein
MPNERTSTMKRLLLGFFVLAGTPLLGCGAVTNAIDCNKICDRYQSCYNKTYDTSACGDRCRSNANSDANYMQKSQTCSACLDNNTDCAAATWHCASECLGIVP